MITVLRSPYRPDLAPCDPSLFPRLKLRQKKRRFDTVKEIKAKSQDVPKVLTSTDFQHFFQSLESLYRRKR